VQLLPPVIHQQYITPMDRIWPQLEAAMIEPIRETVISDLSGPQILQIRQSTRISKRVQKPKTSVNRLSQIAGKKLVFPLLGSWWIYHQDKYLAFQHKLI
jgi:hypothetical protein